MFRQLSSSVVVYGRRAGLSGAMYVQGLRFAMRTNPGYQARTDLCGFLRLGATQDNEITHEDLDRLRLLIEGRRFHLYQSLIGP